MESTDPLTTLRQAHVGDASGLAQLHAETVAIAYADIFPADAPAPTPADLAPSYRSLLETADADTWVVERGEVVVASIVLIVDVSVPAQLRIERFNVHPQHQSQGLGSALYQWAIAEARDRGASRLNLWVLEDNARARAIYEAWGWTLVPGFVLANEPPEVLDVLYELALEPNAAATS